eukprot:gnl/MRDRNA2_/MRDRNA2_57615_c0_seq1.p1 gnl/MRDRNA2_/MRDRNA2_57615_c0~~gnl/MRDRNA2_/MRDRNA2_57615_c0_seq1.p1  ORF type:complete len:280 (+),score=63.24 gnl/MRDRNA2_/MRDRNA2_57615_c0_seq1:235-1074(+)
MAAMLGVVLAAVRSISYDRMQVKRRATLAAGTAAAAAAEAAAAAAAAQGATSVGCFSWGAVTALAKASNAAEAAARAAVKVAAAATDIPKKLWIKEEQELARTARRFLGRFTDRVEGMKLSFKPGMRYTRAQGAAMSAYHKSWQALNHVPPHLHLSSADDLGISGLPSKENRNRRNRALKNWTANAAAFGDVTNDDASDFPIVAKASHLTGSKLVKRISPWATSMTGQHVGNLSAQDLVESAWAIAQTDKANAQLLEPLARVAEQLTGNFNMQELAITA